MTLENDSLLARQPDKTGLTARLLARRPVSISCHGGGLS